MALSDFRKRRGEMKNHVDKIAEMRNDYMSNLDKTLARRLTWAGLNGKNPKHTTTIARFNAETGAFSTSFAGVEDSASFFKKAVEVSNAYVEWVKSKDKGYSELEYSDMRNFFVGAIGELFFESIMENIKCIFAPDRGKDYRRYDFHQVSPERERKDFGVDFYALVNDIPSVIQVKFWNPFNKKNTVGVDIVEKAHSQGVARDIIDNSDKGNVVICTLGSEESIFSSLKRVPEYRDKVVVIGRNALMATVDNRLQLTFWERFFNFLAGLGK